MTKKIPGKRIATRTAVSSDKFRCNDDAQRFVHSFLEVRNSAVAICRGPWSPIDVSGLKLRS